MLSTLKKSPEKRKREGKTRKADTEMLGVKGGGGLDCKQDQMLLQHITNRKTKEDTGAEGWVQRQKPGSSHSDGFHIFLMLEMRSNTKSKGRVIELEF